MNSVSHGRSMEIVLEPALIQGWPKDAAAAIHGSAETEWRSATTDLTIIIEKRALLRDCIMRGLSNSRLEGEIQAYDTISEWLAHYDPTADNAPLVLLSVEDRNAAELKADCLAIGKSVGHQVPIVLLADDESMSYIVGALNDGVRGYIPKTLPLRVAVEAMQLVRAGGVFIPAHSFMQSATSNREMRAASGSGCSAQMFSGRQAAVVTALRKGTSNKVIAHELQMAEGTVKVHVRNIMRKLKARNRTHVAFLLNESEAAR